MKKKKRKTNTKKILKEKLHLERIDYKAHICTFFRPYCEGYFCIYSRKKTEEYDKEVYTTKKNWNYSVLVKLDMLLLMLVLLLLLCHTKTKSWWRKRRKEKKSTQIHRISISLVLFFYINFLFNKMLGMEWNGIFNAILANKNYSFFSYDSLKK